jgi:hypothetical protein
VKKAARSNQQGVYLSKRLDVNVEKGRQIDSLNYSAEEHRVKNPKKCKF